MFPGRKGEGGVNPVKKVYPRFFFHHNSFVCLLVYHFSPYWKTFHLYDGGQCLLVEEKTQICYTMYLGRDHRPSASKLTNFLTQTHRYEQDSNWRGLEVKGLVIWDRCLNHLATEAVFPQLLKANTKYKKKNLPSHVCSQIPILEGGRASSSLLLLTFEFHFLTTFQTLNILCR
jgi:hypothetical protein